MSSTARRWLTRFADERSVYLAVNLGTNLLFLVRSYVAMRVLGYAELGQVALLQSLAMFVGVMQFGVINGGYRLLCGAQSAGAPAVNDTVWTILLLIAAACAMVGLMLPLWSDDAAVLLALELGLLAGVGTLLRNWLTSNLTAGQRLRQLNRDSLLAALLSLSALLFVPLAPLQACLASILIQPLAFVALAMWHEPALRPKAFRLDRELTRKLLSSGFVVFLTSLFLQANLQVERWYVTETIGLEALGHLYLAILFVNLFQILPSSLDGLFLPRLVRAHEAGQALLIRLDLRRLLALLALYCLLSAAAVGLLAVPVLEWLLPKYVQDLPYLWWVLPGLVVYTLSSPFAIVFNVLIRYRVFLIAFGGGSLLTIAAFVLADLGGHRLSLDDVSALRSMVYAFMGIVLVSGWAALTRDRPGFRFLGRQGPAAGA